MPTEKTKDDKSRIPDGVDIEETEEYVPYEQPWADPGVPLLEDPEVDAGGEDDTPEAPDVPDEDRGL